MEYQKCERCKQWVESHLVNSFVGYGLVCKRCTRRVIDLAIVADSTEPKQKPKFRKDTYDLSKITADDEEDDDE